VSDAGSCEHCGRKGRFYPAQPDGYVAWHEWAERIAWHEWAERKCKTHHAERCPGCQQFTVWRAGAAREETTP